MVFTTLNYNPFYYEQLKVMLTSLSLNSPNDKASIELVDFPDKECAILASKFPHYKFTQTRLNLDKVDARQTQNIMCCRRTQIIKDGLKKHQLVAWFDTDLIIRKNLNDFWNLCKPNALAIRYRPYFKYNPIEGKLGFDYFKSQGGHSTNERIAFQAGIFCVNKSEGIIKYISNWHDAVQKDIEWAADQKHLYREYMKMRYEIDICVLPDTFNDTYFLDNSHVWHSKASHWQNPVFQAEYQHYLKIFNTKKNKKSPTSVVDDIGSIPQA